MRSLLVFMLCMLFLAFYSNRERIVLDKEILNGTKLIKVVMIKESNPDGVKLAYSLYKPMAILNDAYQLMENGSVMKLDSRIDGSDFVLNLTASENISLPFLIKAVQIIRHNKDIISQVDKVLFFPFEGDYVWRIDMISGIKIYMGVLSCIDDSLQQRLNWICSEHFDLNSCEYVKIYFKTGIVYKLKAQNLKSNTEDKKPKILSKSIIKSR